VFGCDACLDSCPVGAERFDSHPDFVPSLMDEARPVLVELLALDDANFRARYQGRAIMRAKRDGLVRNACVALGNVGKPADVAALSVALDDGSAVVRGHAAWALGRIAARFGDRGALGALGAQLLVEADASVREEIAAAIDDAEGGVPGR
jgi:epoxyqueuosine reductase